MFVVGYSTSFDQPFVLSKKPSDKAVAVIASLYREEPTGRDGKPLSLCQWVLTPDHVHLAWDGEEKFYFWKEWLQWIIDKILRSEDIEISGDVHYQGEEESDYGTIEIVKGRVYCFPG